jgi:hypothetical protein
MKTVIRNFSAAKLQQLIAVKRQIERLEMRLEKLVGVIDPGAGYVLRKRRQMSAAGRKAIAAAAKARWAKWRASQK